MKENTTDYFSRLGRNISDYFISIANTFNFSRPLYQDNPTVGLYSRTDLTPQQKDKIAMSRD